MFDPRNLNRDQLAALDDAIGLYLNSRRHAPFDFSLNLLSDCQNARLKVLLRQAGSPQEVVALARAVEFAANVTRSERKRQLFYALQSVVQP